MAKRFITSMINEKLAEIVAKAAEADVIRHTGIADGWFVKRGPLQRDPQAAGVNILVTSNDPEKPSSWAHEKLKRTELLGGGHGPTYNRLALGFQEIGSKSHGWSRRHTIRLTVFLGRTGLDLAEREEMAELVLGAVEYALLTDDRLVGLEDDFGEKVLGDFAILSKSRLDGGGESGIFRGKLWVQIFTYRKL